MTQQQLNDYIDKFQAKTKLLLLHYDKPDFVFTGNYRFRLADIVFDIDTKQPNELILDWYRESVNNELDKGYIPLTYSEYVKQF